MMFPLTNIGLSVKPWTTAQKWDVRFVAGTLFEHSGVIEHYD